MRTVTAPDGSVHTVRIEWIGNRIRRAPVELRQRVRRTGRLARRGDDTEREIPTALDHATGCLDLDELAFVLLALVAAALVVVFVLPALYGLVELLVVLVLGALVWAFRVLFGRPWRIVHRGPGDVEAASCEVVGWRRAHATVVAAADEISRSGSSRRSFRWSRFS